MNIVILDGYSLNPGDLDWGDLHTLGTLSVFDRTPPHLVLERVSGAAVVFTNKVRLSRDLLSQLPDLKYIGVFATGYDIIDLEGAGALDITVTNVPTYGTDAVAQHTIALMLELSNQVGLHHKSVKNGDWVSSPDWTYTLSPLQELAGKTLGLIGYGKIGQKVAKIARAFGMNVCYHTRKPKTDIPDQCVSLDTIFVESDYISLHLPLTPESQSLINRTTLDKMKKTAYLINTSRGGLIQENELASALQEGSIAGAALDVLSEEPPSADHPLLQAPNTIITPHNAWVAKEARQRLLDTAIANLKAFLEGKAQNVVR